MMIQKQFLLFPFLGALLLLSCQPSAPSVQDVPEKTSDSLSGAELIDRLKAEAVDESDIFGRLQATVKVLQEEFARSATTLTAQKDVRVVLDGDCLLVLSNYPAAGEEIQVSLKDLDPKGLQLIPDLMEGDFPGLRLRTLAEKPVVVIREKGGAVRQTSELEIFMATRQSIERITPYMLQALNICHGVEYPE